MKNKILIIFGTILILIAVGNSIFNISSLPTSFLRDSNNLFLKPTQISPSNNENISVDIPDPSAIAENSGNISALEDNKSSTPQNDVLPNSDEGFLPLQIKKDEEQSVSTPSNIVPIVPIRIHIQSIDLSAPIIQATKEEIEINKTKYVQWTAPDLFAVGWQYDSASINQHGNTVLNGHHNVHGKVFENLNKLNSGDRIILDGSDGKKYAYVITNVMILPEKDQPLSVRLDNARWTLPSNDERLTLITCWPYYSNTHRLIIVARPDILFTTEIIQ